jgi:hypothetical protein
MVIDVGKSTPNVTGVVVALIKIDVAGAVFIFRVIPIPVNGAILYICEFVAAHSAIILAIVVDPAVGLLAVEVRKEAPVAVKVAAIVMVIDVVKILPLGSTVELS